MTTDYILETCSCLVLACLIVGGIAFFLWAAVVIAWFFALFAIPLSLLLMMVVGLWKARPSLKQR